MRAHLSTNTLVSPSTATFGPFTLVPARQELRDGETPVCLGSRAMALLCALVERSGEVLSRDELVAKVWPSTFVEETSLRVQIAALRKVLGERQRGERYIVNVIGRGYSFVAPVTWQHTQRSVDPSETMPTRHNLPARLARAIGRDEVVAALGVRLTRRRLVSIIGPGGIGKTTVALAVAEVALGAFEHGVFMVDLAPLSESEAVPSALLAVLAIAAPQHDVVAALHAFLRERRMLLVFDNCEHLVDAVAQLVDGLLRVCPRLHVLTTSREPLNVESEWVHRQSALATPEPVVPLSVEQAFGYSAIRLFVERATASHDSFVLTEDNLNAVRQVCCRLDGMPLALELAAGRIASLGIQGLADRLDQVFTLLTSGRRLGDPRHRAMKAILEWSHELLNEGERLVLRRLSVFRAAFTLDAACQVAADDWLHASAVAEHLISLVDKSLVTVNANQDVTHYRLLYVTRKFAELQLSAADETDSLSRRHAQYLRDEVVRLRSSPTSSTSNLMAFYELTFEDVDAAIQWALSKPSTVELGIHLAVEFAAPELGFVDKMLTRIERALRYVTDLDPALPELELEARCRWSLLSGYSNAFEIHQDSMFEHMLDLISGVEPQHRVACFHGMSVGAFGQGNYQASHRFAEALSTLHDLPMAARQAERMLALNDHFMGRHQQTQGPVQSLITEVLTVTRTPSMESARYSFSMRLVMARILWMQGHVDQAAAMAKGSLADSSKACPFARCKALGLAVVPIALWRGDLQAAEAATQQLRELACRYSLEYWQSWVEHFSKILVARYADVPVCGPWPGDVAREFPSRNPTELDALPTFAEELLTPAALDRVEQGDVGWCAPEILRVQGMRLLRDGGATVVTQGQAILDRSLALARSQGALSWELRTACSLARLWHRQDRSTNAQVLLASTCARFTEGYGTADLVVARQLLDEISVPLQQVEISSSIRA